METCILGLGGRTFDLVLAGAGPTGRIESTCVASHPVRIEASVSADGSIEGAAWTDALRAAGKLVAKARHATRGGHLVAVAPHALGGAKNAAAFALAVRRKLGVSLSLLSAADSARLAYRGVRDEKRVGRGDFSVIHVGDETLDVVAGSGGDCELLEIVALGVTRLHRAYGATDSGLLATDAGALFSLLRLSSGPACRKLRHWGQAAPVFASDNAVAVRELARAWGFLDRASDTMDRMALHAMIPEILAASPDQLGVDLARANLVGTSAIVIDALSDLLGMREVSLASHGVLEGVALDVLEAARLAGGVAATGTDSHAGNPPFTRASR